MAPYNGYREQALKIVILAVMLVFLSGHASADTWTVDDSGDANYTIIQHAIDNASTGDTILVYSGTYNENVNITKQLTLQGLDTSSGQPIVDGMGDRSVITLSADSITLDGFIVTNSGKKTGDAGIQVISNNNMITGNIVINNNYGVHLEYSSYNNITGNNISINEEGVYLYSSENNNLSRNTAIKNKYEGVFIWNSADNNITGNNLSENEFGILMWDSRNNSLTDNRVNNNSKGIYLTTSTENILKNNQMSENTYNFGVLGWDVVAIGTSQKSSKIMQDSQMSSSSNIFEGLDIPFLNDIDTSNLVDNKSIYYLIGASDIVIDLSSKAGMVYCIHCDNVTVQDLNLVNNYAGVFFYHTNNSNIQDNYLCNNDWYGIVLDSTYNTTVLGNNVNNSGCEGMYLVHSNNSYIINNTVNNSFGNSMNIQISSNNKLIGNTINYGYRGLNLFDSSNNTIIDNNVLDNHYEGVMLESSMNNTIYHNMFSNNSPNAVDFSFNNVWDFGYPTGGNYWGNYPGIDADNDGIGDTPYNISGGTGSQDKYPLMEPWSEVDLIHPAKDESDSTGGNGGSSNGGGGSSGENYENIVISETEREYVNKDIKVSYRFDMDGNPVRYINFTPLVSYGKIAAKVEVLKNTSTLADQPPLNVVYKNINIWVGNLGWANPENMANPTVNFMVEKSWIAENTIDEPTIGLYRYNNEIWVPLVTTRIGSDVNYIYFEAETSGFSPFCITGKKLSLSASPGGEGVIVKPTIIEDISNNQESNAKEPEVPGFSIFSNICILYVLVLILHRRDNK